MPARTVVKVQIEIGRALPTVTIYGSGSRTVYIGDIPSDIVEKMKSRNKAYFYATNRNWRWVLHERVPESAYLPA